MRLCTGVVALCCMLAAASASGQFEVFDGKPKKVLSFAHYSWELAVPSLKANFQLISPVFLSENLWQENPLYPDSGHGAGTIYSLGVCIGYYFTDSAIKNYILRVPIR